MINMKNILKDIRRSIILAAALLIICCGIYPLAVWGIAQLVFPSNANGSLIPTLNNNRGAQLIGQQFTSPRYFHPRPSAAGKGYDPTQSGGSNYGPLSKTLMEQIRFRINTYRTENHLSPQQKIPIDAVTASASGLDPHISVENARLQANRIANIRGIDLKTIYSTVEKCTENRQLGLLGEKRVNILLLNLELDKIEINTVK